MAIKKLVTNIGVFYIHCFDEIEFANPYDYLMSQGIQMHLIKYLQSIERRFGTCPKWLYNSLKRLLSLKVKKGLIAIMMSTKPPLEFDEIISGKLKKKKQLEKLKNATLSPEQLLSLLIYAGSKGYTLSHYSFVEKIGGGGEKAQAYIYKRKDGTVVSNLTGLSDKELNYMLENQELINAFVLDKEDKWFCIFQRKKGVLGKEPGKYGSSPHLHFISNTYNVRRESFVSDIKRGKYPSKTFHIQLTDYHENKDGNS